MLSLKPITRHEDVETNRVNCKPNSCTRHPWPEGHSTAKVPGSWRQTCLAEVPCTGPYGRPGITDVCNSLAPLDYSHLWKGVGKGLITSGESDASDEKSQFGLRLFTMQSKMQDNISCMPVIARGACSTTWSWKPFFKEKAAMQCFWTYFDSLFFQFMHELFLYFQGTKGWVSEAWNRWIMCEGERWSTQPQHSSFPLRSLPSSLKTAQKNWKGTASSWGAKEWKDQFFILLIFYAEFEEKM